MSLKSWKVYIRGKPLIRRNECNSCPIHSYTHATDLITDVLSEKINKRVDRASRGIQVFVLLAPLFFYFSEDYRTRQQKGTALIIQCLFLSIKG